MIRRELIGPYAACISRIKDRRRAAKSRRPVSNEIGGLDRGRTRKHWRDSSKVAQNWAAEAKPPNPHIG